MIFLLLLCADFRADYLPAARKLEQTYSQCQAKVTVTVTNDKDDHRTNTSYAFTLDGNKAKFDRTIRENGEFVFRRCIVGTPDLSFMILTKDGDTILEHVDRSGDKYTTVVEQADPVRAAFAFLGKSLSERLATCHIKSVSRERLEFTDVEPDGLTIDGWVRFLPDYRIDHSEFNLKRGDYAWRRVEQVNYHNGIVASVDATVYDPDRTATERYVVDIEFGPVPASEFALSKYGYNDRIGVAEKRRWVWVVVGAVVVVIALRLAQLKARRREFNP